MRRGLAIIFLVIVLLNTAGYYLVYEGWKWHTSITWAFDESAPSHEMIIQIPLTVPYATQPKDWEAADGQFEYKGEVYRIVKQKLELDAVYIACVKDHESSRINQELGEFVKTFSDQHPGGKPSMKSFPGLVKEYLSDRISVQTSVSGWSQTVTVASAKANFIPSFFASIVHPPERA